MSGDGRLWRATTTVTLLAVTGLAAPGLPSEPTGLRVLALVGTGLVVLGVIILTRLVAVRD